MILKNKKIAGNILALFVSLTVSILLLEVIVRVFLPQRIETPFNCFAADPLLGWKTKPGLRQTFNAADFSMYVEANKEGFRDVEHTYKKPEGAFRIVGLGDSMLFGYGVGYEDTALKRLGQLLSSDNPLEPKIETINLGISGYDINQYKKSLEIEGARYSPDLVIMFFYVGNDWTDKENSYLDSKVDKRGFLVEPKADSTALRILLSPVRAFLKSYSQLYMLLRDRIKGWLMKNKIMAVPYIDLYKKDLNLEKKYIHTLETIKQTSLYCRNELSCPFLLCIIPEKMQVRKPLLELAINAYKINPQDYDWRNTQDTLIKYCEKNKIMYIDLLPALSEAEINKPTYLEIDWHWNKYGHSLAAQEIYKYLKTKETK